MSQPAYNIFLAIGLIVIIGFIAAYIFERFKFSDVIILMFVGTLIGPVYNIASIIGPISLLAPYIGTLALIVMLFDGGLNLDLFKVLTSLSKAAGFTILVFILTVIFLGVSMHFILGWTYLEGYLLGAIVGGTSSAIVIPLISKMSLNDEAKIILTIESAITDALCIIVGIILIGVISLGTVNVRDIAGSFASAFSIAIVIGAMFAVFWIGIINKLYVKQVRYSMTLAVVFILYAIVEFVSGNGPIAVLVFALLLGNFNELATRLRFKGEFSLDPVLKTFQTEVSFFVRTFFFIFTGMMFKVEILSNLTVLRTSGLIFIVLIIARIFGVQILSMSDKIIAPYKKSILSMMARGLAAAVLASMPLASGIIIPYFTDMVFNIIILTNLATTIGVFIVERKVSLK